MQSTPIFLPGESHGLGSLVGCSTWGHKNADMTEPLTLSLSGQNQSIYTLADRGSSLASETVDDLGSVRAENRYVY